MAIRYRVSDLPTVGTGAFTPLASTNPLASSHGLVRIEAAWGTSAVAAPKPAALPAVTARGIADGNASARAEDVTPDFILPAIAIPYADNMGPEMDTGIGMARRRLCEIPVPAVDPTRVPTVAQGARKTGGRAALPWPRAFQRWPSLTGRGSAG